MTTVRDLCIEKTTRLTVDEVIAEATKQTIARGIIDLAEMRLPPAVQVIDTIVSAKITKQRAVKDKVVFEGEVRVKVVFEADEPGQPVKVADEVLRFADSVSLPGVTPTTKIFVTTEVEQVDVDLMDKVNAGFNELDITVVVKTLVKAVAERTLNVVTDVVGPRGLRVEKELIRTRTLIKAASKQVLIRETVNLEDLSKPPFVQLVDTLGTASIDEFDVLTDKVVFEGTAEVKVLYATTGGEVVALAEKMRFDGFVDIPGLEPGDEVEISAEVEFIGVEARDKDNDGDKEILIKTVVVRVEASAFKTRQVEVVINVTGVKNIQVKKELVRVEDVVGEDEVQVTIRETLDPQEEEKPCIQQVIDCRAIVQSTTVEVLPNKVVVSGEVELKVVFESVDQTVNVIKGFFQFSGVLDIPGAEPGDQVLTSVEVEDVSCTLVGKDCPPVEVLAILGITAKVVRSKQKDVVIEVFCPSVPTPPIGFICEAVVTANGVRVRSGPSTAFPVIAVVNRGDQVTVLEEVGNFRRVFLPEPEGFEGFIFKDFVRCISPPLG